MPRGNTVTPHEQRVINGRKGGIRSQTPEYLAMRLVSNWDTYSEQQQDVLRACCGPSCAANDLAARTNRPG